MIKTSTQAFAFFSPTPDYLTGLSSYTDSLVSAYAAANPARSVRLYTNVRPQVFQLVHSMPNVTVLQLQRTLLPYRIDVLRLAAVAAKKAAEFSIDRAIVFTTPIFSLRRRCKQIMVLHDLYDVDPKYRELNRVIWTRIQLWIGFRLVDKIVCVSETTRRLAADRIGNSAKLVVVQEASKFRPIEKDQVAAVADREGFLFVANVTVTKNAECLLAALRIADGGSPGYPEMEPGPLRGLSVTWVGQDPHGIVGNWVLKHGPVRNFVHAGVVSDTELARLYQKAEALVVPSWIEGFCLPVLEAQAFGTPVLASDISILREVAGDGALYFDPTQPSDLLRIIDVLRALTPAKKAQLADSALTNARRFSWHRAARELEALLCTS